MNYFSLLVVLLPIVLTSCNNPRIGRMNVVSHSEFGGMVPNPVKQSLDKIFKKRDWTAYIERRYRGASVDVVWVFGKDQSVQSWVVQKGLWTDLHGNTQTQALTIALQPDLRVLTRSPGERDITYFCVEIVKLLCGDSGVLLDPGHGEFIDNNLQIDKEYHLGPEDKTHQIIKPYCSSIKYLAGLNRVEVVFNYLEMGGIVKEWRVVIDKKVIKEVHVRKILENVLLERWIPT